MVQQKMEQPEHRNSLGYVISERGFRRLSETRVRSWNGGNVSGMGRDKPELPDCTFWDRVERVGCSRYQPVNRKDPVQTRVAIPAADPPDNIMHG